MVLYGNRVDRSREPASAVLSSRKYKSPESPQTLTHWRHRPGMRHIRVEKLWRKARFRDDQHRHISNAVLFLASDESRYITGVSLPVDTGGLLK